MLVKNQINQLGQDGQGWPWAIRIAIVSPSTSFSIFSFIVDLADTFPVTVAASASSIDFWSLKLTNNNLIMVCERSFRIFRKTQKGTNVILIHSLSPFGFLHYFGLIKAHKTFQFGTLPLKPKWCCVFWSGLVWSGLVWSGLFDIKYIRHDYLQKYQKNCFKFNNFWGMMCVRSWECGILESTALCSR